MSKEYAYVANVTLDDGTEVVVDLEERGWADKDVLSRARHWALVPKPGELTLEQKPWPLVSVVIPAGAKPVFRSRVFRGSIYARSLDQAERRVIPRLVISEFRSYGIGWKKGRTQVWTWAHPNGAVEMSYGPDPETRIGTILRNHLNTVIVEEPEPEPEVEDDESSPAE